MRKIILNKEEAIEVADTERIVRVLKERGYEISEANAMALWLRRSDSMAASWLFLSDPWLFLSDEDTDLFDELIRHVREGEIFEENKK